MLRRSIPAGAAYLNLGHSNLTPRTLGAVRSVQNSRLAVFIHDTIPLDFPQYQREGSVERFRQHLDLAGQADIILTSSDAAAQGISRHLSDPPPIHAAPLGVDLKTPDRSALPGGIETDRPYFVVLGTLEPRKNIGLLLDVWERLGAEPPLLYLVGRRGWNNEEVFARLDAGVPGVTELPDLSDGAVAALLSGARALLFPSEAEGFGLPLAEAAALGTPVVCGDLAICREVLGEVGIYLPTSDPYPWENTVRTLTEQTPPDPPSYAAPTWADHFAVALSVT
ncbi:glycosyltransferase family 4 protein [Histidinibacterium aquaticum]